MAALSANYSWIIKCPLLDLLLPALSCGSMNNRLSSYSHTQVTSNGNGIKTPNRGGNIYMTLVQDTAFQLKDFKIFKECNISFCILWQKTKNRISTCFFRIKKICIFFLVLPSKSCLVKQIVFFRKANIWFQWSK